MATQTVFDLGRVAEGVQTIPFPTVQLTPSERQPISFAQQNWDGQIGALQSVYIDNPNNAVIGVIVPNTGQTVIMPPYTAGWQPCFIPAGQTVEVVGVPNRASITGMVVSLVFCNAQIPLGFSPLLPQGVNDTPVAAAVISFNTIATHQLVAGVAGQTIRVHQLYLRANGTTSLQFLSAATALEGAANMANGIPFILPYSPLPWFETSAADALNVSSSAAVIVGGRLIYSQSE